MIASSGADATFLQAIEVEGEILMIRTSPMKNPAPVAIGLSLGLMGWMLGVANAQEQSIAAAANAARVLKSDEIHKIYGDRTWMWGDGAGYFQAKDRAFTAWANEGRKASYANGSWQLNDQGRLCFRAQWRAIGGGREARTCFDHRTDDKRIYQRRLPGGRWYVFSHLPPMADDEVQKIKEGNLVSENYERNKQYVAKNTPKRKGLKKKKKKKKGRR